MKKIIYTLVTLQAFLLSSSVFGQETDVGPARDQGLWQTLIMVAIALSFFYFILWRPEQKRRKALEEQRASLKQGDKVTAMGIIGTILRIEDQTVILKMYDGSKIQVLKGAITDILPADDEETKKAEKEDKNLIKKSGE